MKKITLYKRPLHSSSVSSSPWGQSFCLSHAQRAGIQLSYISRLKGSQSSTSVSFKMLDTCPPLHNGTHSQHRGFEQTSQGSSSWSERNQVTEMEKRDSNTEMSPRDPVGNCAKDVQISIPCRRSSPRRSSPCSRSRGRTSRPPRCTACCDTQTSRAPVTKHSVASKLRIISPTLQSS